MSPLNIRLVMNEYVDFIRHELFCFLDKFVISTSTILKDILHNALSCVEKVQLLHLNTTRLYRLAFCTLRLVVNEYFDFMQH